MPDSPPIALAPSDVAGDVLQEEVNRRRSADGLSLRGQVPRGVRPLNRDAFTTHVAASRPRSGAPAGQRSGRRWRPLAIAACIGALATLAGTAVWGFFPDDVVASMSGLDQAIVSMTTR